MLQLTVLLEDYVDYTNKALAQDGKIQTWKSYCLERLCQHFVKEGREDLMKSTRTPEFIKSVAKYFGENQVIGVNVSESCVGVLIAFMLNIEDEKETGICSKMGQLCYVYNVESPFCSELGDCFFEQYGKSIIRVG